MRNGAEATRRGSEAERRREAPAQCHLRNTKQMDTKRESTERSEAILGRWSRYKPGGLDTEHRRETPTRGDLSMLETVHSEATQNRNP